jgi:probable HAF family extracellular repeat protein
VKSLKLTCMIAFFAMLAVPTGLAAQHKQVQHKRPRYQLFDVGTFGGPTSVTIEAEGVLNKRGTLTGGADTSTTDPYYPDCFDAACYVQHTYRWHDGDLEDLGALYDPGSSIGYWVNSHAEVAGWSENGHIDAQSGWPIWHATLWDADGIHDLGTLGGAYSQANAMNDSGDAFGFAQNKTRTSCVMPVGNPNTETELRAVLWKRGMKPVDIGTLGGPGAFGQTINDRGQMAGFSYTFAGSKHSACPPIDPFFKDKGKKMKDLGTLGGTFGQVWWLNNRGQVVGTSNLKGDKYFHAYFWGGSGRMQDLGTFGGCCSQAWWINERGEIVGSAVRKGNVPWHWRPAVWGQDRKIRDLGTLPGDRCGFANAVNSKGQIVGTSVTQSGICRWPGPGMTAVLWEDNKVIDLNQRIDPGAGLNLVIALEINDRGDIAGIGVPPGCDSSQMDTCGHAFVLTPCDDKDRDDEGCSEGVPSWRRKDSVGATQ